MKKYTLVLCIILLSLLLLPCSSMAKTGEIIDIQAGPNMAIALISDGTVWTLTMKYSYAGSEPVSKQVLGLTEVKAVSCGGDHSLALKNDGTVWKWSFDYSAMEPGVPVIVDGLSDITAISAGGTETKSFDLALKEDGTVWAWGYNDLYQLGNGTIENSLTPVQIPEINGVTAISAGESQGLALRNDGTIWQWGNLSNQAGDEYSTPTLVEDLTNVIKIDAGGSYNLAMQNSGDVWLWGHPSLAKIPDIESPVDFSAGSEMYYNPMFLKSDGTVWNTSTSMIDGSPCTPEQMTVIDNVQLIDASNSAYFVKKDGTAYIQVSNGTVPYKVPGFEPTASGNLIVEPDGNITIKQGETKKIKVLVVDSNGKSTNVTTKATYTITDTNVAKVSKGTITALQHGCTKLQISYQEASLEIDIYVEPAPVVFPKIQIEDTNGKSIKTLSIKMGESVQLNIFGYPKKGEKQYITHDCTFTTKPTGIISIDYGMIQPLKAGKTALTVKYGKKSAKVSVQVTN